MSDGLTLYIVAGLFEWVRVYRVYGCPICATIAGLFWLPILFWCALTGAGGSR